jgi:hypothetical protein
MNKSSLTPFLLIPKVISYVILVAGCWLTIFWVARNLPLLAVSIAILCGVVVTIGKLSRIESVAVLIVAGLIIPVLVAVILGISVGLDSRLEKLLNDSDGWVRMGVMVSSGVVGTLIAKLISERSRRKENRVGLD